jgi:predicted AAA+ superfamily ATPase
MINRIFKPLLSKSFFIFGARGTGKSTWIRNSFKPDTAITINMISAQDSSQYLGRPEQFKQMLDYHRPNSKIEWIVVDEIQKDPALLDLVHDEIESHKRYKFVMTGSSARKLKRGGANLLAGRASWNSFHPLTEQELGQNFNLDEALNWGTLPSITGTQTAEKIEYLRSYAHLYLKEEILEEQLSRNVVGFKKFLEVSAQMNAKILNYSKIARDAGLESPTVKTYFDILEDTYLGFRLLAYNQSVRKQQSTHPKFYLFDLGVQKALLRSLDSTHLPGSSAYGDAFESWVIMEIYRLNQLLKKDFELFYLRTKDDAEIDLILEKPNQPKILVEIKSSEQIDAIEVAKLERLGSTFSSKKMYYLSRCPFPQKIGKVECLHYLQGLKEIISL